MILLQPVWLILLLPLAVVLVTWKLPSRLLRILRAIIMVLIVLAMCDTNINLPSRVGTVVVVADRSHSMPPNSQDKMKEAVDLIKSEMSDADKLAVVSFGQTIAIEKSPQNPDFTGFVSQVGPDASNLANAIDTALALIPKAGSGRLLVLSDGLWTGSNPDTPATRAAAQNIAIDYRLLKHDTAGDVAISHIDAPQSVTPGQAYMITAWIYSPAAQEISYELVRKQLIISQGKKNISSGLSSITFRDIAQTSGVQQYSVNITTSGKDPIPQNNSAKLLIGVEGPKPILCIADHENSGLASLLQKGRLQIESALPQYCQWSLEDLAGFSAVLIEDLPAGHIGTAGMETIAAWTKETGSGMFMTGGQHSYAPGGYFRSPLEPIMPVSMELRREHRKLSLAIVVALDRSGSMTAPVGGGRSKMDLANIASAQVLDMLSPMDELGVVAVDSSSHIISKCRPIEDNSSLRNDILRIHSTGGGIFVYEALKTSAQMISEAKAGTKHIILFADAADSEQPGQYKELLQNCREAGVTVSVIGLGKPTDCDADFLRDVASRGEGRCFFTENAEELPRLFAQDTFVVARSSFIDEPTPIRITSGMRIVSSENFTDAPAVGGYNLCYIRPGANLATVTVDEYDAPVLATWQAGAGRVACYTGQADGKLAGPLANWPSVGEFFTSIARWTAGDPDTLGENMLVRQTVKNGICSIQLHLDPDRQVEPFSQPPKVTTLQGQPGSTTKTIKNELLWTNADMLEIDIPLPGSETSLSTVEVEGVGKVTLPPVCLPYSPEFKPVIDQRPTDTMQMLAHTTGGKERVKLADIWRDIPRKTRLINISPILAIIAIVLFLLEILERRTGVLSQKKWRLQKHKAIAEAEEQPTEPQPSAPLINLNLRQKLTYFIKSTKKPQSSQPARQPDKSQKPPQSQEQPDMLDAFQKARSQARKRKK